MNDKNVPGLWKVYLLQCSDGTYYCGITSNLERRLDQHNGLIKGGPKYTSGRRPNILLGLKICESKSAALKLEAAAKKLSKNAKLKFFLNQG